MSSPALGVLFLFTVSLTCSRKHCCMEHQSHDPVIDLACICCASSQTVALLQTAALGYKDYRFWSLQIFTSHAFIDSFDRRKEECMNRMLFRKVRKTFPYAVEVRLSHSVTVMMVILRLVSCPLSPRYWLCDIPTV